MQLHAPRSEALTGKGSPPVMQRAMPGREGVAQYSSLLHLPPRRSGALFGLRRLMSIKMIDLILPHVQKDTGRYVIDGFPNALDFRKCIFPDRSLAPLLTLLFALVGGAH